MSEIHALSGAYVTNALDDIERAAFEHHLAGCTACQREVDGLREAAAELARSVAAPPPPALRDRVLVDIGTSRPLPPKALPRESRQPRFRGLLVAAVVALLAASGVGYVAAVWAPWEQQSAHLTAADQIVAAADAQRWTAAAQDGGSVTVTRSSRLSAAVLTMSGLPAAPAGKVYEFWLLKPDQSLTPAGTTSLPQGDFVLDGDAARAIGAGVTLEPAGGSMAPTTPPIAFVNFGPRA